MRTKITSSFVSRVRQGGGGSFSAQGFARHFSDSALVIPNGDNVSMNYDASRERKHTEAILKEVGHAAILSDTNFSWLLGYKLYQDLTKPDAAIIDACKVEEDINRRKKHGGHPTPESAGKFFIRSSQDGKKTLTAATTKQLRETPIIAIGGKDSSQIPKDCSGVASLLEKHLEVDTPEQAWALIGEKAPVVYLSQSTTPTLDRYASEGHISHSKTLSYTHEEAIHVAHAISARFSDRDGNFLKPDNVLPLCGYSFSAGLKQWMAYLHALENTLCSQGMDREEAQNLMGRKVRLAGIASMPDTNGLAMLGKVSTLNSASIFDMGFRCPRKESSILANPEVQEMIKSRGGALHVHVQPKEGDRIQHRCVLYGELANENLGHAPKGYVNAICKYPIISGLYKAYMKGSAEEIIRFEEAFDTQSIALDTLVPSKEYEVIDEMGLGLTRWEQCRVSNFAAQIGRERLAKKQAAIFASSGK